MKFHFAWGHWKDHQDLLVLRRNAFFPDDYGRARRHSWLKLYRRWKFTERKSAELFLRWLTAHWQNPKSLDHDL